MHQRLLNRCGAVPKPPIVTGASSLQVLEWLKSGPQVASPQRPTAMEKVGLQLVGYLGLAESLQVRVLIAPPPRACIIHSMRLYVYMPVHNIAYGSCIYVCLC